MIDRFKVNAHNSTRVEETALRETVRRIFTACGVSQIDADTATDVLVTADLRGIDSHGVSNSLRGYVQGFHDQEVLYQN